MKRTVEFRWPPSIGEGSVVLRELSAEETLQVVSAFSDPFRGTLELAKRAIVRVDGLDVTPERRDEVWSTLSAKQRDLVLDAYRWLHVATQEEREAFFASATLSVAS